MIMTILHHPDPRLRTRAQAVEPGVIASQGFQSLIDDMLETMYASGGIGLAATQVNVHQRLLVMDVSPSRDQPWALINPRLLESSGQRSFMEGCLSVPGASSEVRRADRVTISFLDRQGQPQELVADGLFATCVQHEMDHLEGILFLDRVSSLRRDRALKQASRAIRS